MPILGKHIFIHIPKCGGTSIEHSYGIDTSNLNTNYNLYFGRDNNKDSPYIHVKGVGYILQHLTAKELKTNLNEKYIFDNTFTIVRNPLTRYISELNWKKFDKTSINNLPYKTKLFNPNEYINKKQHQHNKQMYEFIYDNNVKLVNKIFRFEQIQEAFDYINKKSIKMNSNKNITINDLTKQHIHSVYDTFYMDYNLFGYLDVDVLTYYLNKISGKNIIITFTDFKYLPVFDIFYSYFSKLNLNNLLVISLDEKTFINLKKRNIFTLLFKYEIDHRNNFWKFRYNTIEKIFKISKKNIIHTDSDCIWFNNINKYLKPIINYDIIGQMAYGHPKTVVDKLGIVLCCGFYKIYFNSKTVNLFSEIEKKGYNKNILDDQIRINNYIMHEHESITSNEYGKSITIKKSNIKILLLNPNIISRTKYNNNVYLFHPCLKGTNINEKVNKLKSYLSKR